mgnify:FL=1
MSRCYYLDYRSYGLLSSANDKYICRLCKQEFAADSAQVRYTCNSDSGDRYKDCEVYRYHTK